jgi:GntR family transcriptional regulator
VAGTSPAPPARAGLAEHPGVVQRNRRAHGAGGVIDGAPAEERPANLDEAEELAIAPGTPLFHLERVRMLDGVPIALDLTKITAALVPDIGSRDFTREPFYDSLAAAGIEPMRANSTIEAREADRPTAEHLNIAVGKPLVVMHQTAVDGTERPLFSSTIFYVGDRYWLRTSFARSAD